VDDVSQAALGRGVIENKHSTDVESETLPLV